MAFGNRKTHGRHVMTEIERLTNVREKLEEARRYVGMAREAVDVLDDCDSDCVDSLIAIVTNAIAMRQVDPDATRGAIDYARGWLAWSISRIELEERWKIERA
jgi:hypothetical protein